MRPVIKWAFGSSVSKSGPPGEGRHEGLVPRNDVLTNGFIWFSLAWTFARILFVPRLRSPWKTHKALRTWRRLFALFEAIRSWESLYTSLSSSQLHRDFFRFFFFFSQEFFILKRQTRDGGKYGIWKICSRATQNLGTCKYFKKNQTFFLYRFRVR